MHVVVVGAGMAGLAAARALAGHASRLTLVEHDSLPRRPDDRAGVPQGRHPHALLVAGNEALEQLFPGLTDELLSHGAVRADAAGDIVFWQNGAFRTKFHSGLSVLSATRALLEYCVRRRVERTTPITTAHVRRLTGHPDTGVTGIETTDGRHTRADLVVDASGRAGLLRGSGVDAPERETVRVDVGYATRMLRRRAGDLDGLLLAGVADTPPRRRFGVAFAVDGDRWQVTLGGWHGDHAPLDPLGYQAFAETLPHNMIARLLRTAEPLTGIQHHTFPASHRRRFERQRHPSPGYVAIGDVLCSVNPIYGQGVTMAALEALALRRHHADARGYYRAAARIVDTPWQIATGADFQFPETAGRRPPGLRFFNGYVRRVVLGTHVSPSLHLEMLRVQHLLAPPSALLRPSTVARTLWWSRRSPARIT